MKIDTEELAVSLAESREAYVQDLVRSCGNDYEKGKLAGAIIVLDEIMAFIEGKEKK